MTAVSFHPDDVDAVLRARHQLLTSHPGWQDIQDAIRLSDLAQAMKEARLAELGIPQVDVQVVERVAAYGRHEPRADRTMLRLIGGTRKEW